MRRRQNEGRKGRAGRGGEGKGKEIRGRRENRSKGEDWEAEGDGR